MRDWAVGMKFVVDLPAETRAQTRHRPAHVRFPGARDIRLPLRASRPGGLAGHLRAVVVRHPDAHRLSLPPTLDAASVSLAPPQGRQAALVGRQDARRIGPPRASRTWSAMATRASAKVPAAPTSSPAPAWMKPGPPARNWPKASSNCSRPSSPSPGNTWKKPTSSAAAQAGWKPKGASPRSRATAFKRAWSAAWWAWRWRV